ncbi:MAG: SDR family oxidoreductase [Bdellovibrionota bacterium]|nr:SDR family oxidoreductase [Bdellovibrionota bacterium]
MKAVVITGCSGLIGKQIAEDFLSKGWSVTGIDIQDCDLERENFYFEYCDLREEDQIEEIFKKLPKLDLLVNCAAKTDQPRIALENLSLDEWNFGLSINLTSYFLCAKHACPLLKKTNGSIINISSTRAFMSEENTFIYTSAKGAIQSLTHSLAVSLSPHIRVNSISPGWIDDESAKHSEEEKNFHLSGRVGKPSDISSLCLYLASDKSHFLNGENITVDGGVTKKMIYP